jgi:pimeloyl-ACP methyl ester carboxylesterase
VVTLPGTLLPTDPARVYVHRRGVGPPLVLVHGFTMSHGYFAGVMDRLAAAYPEGREVIAVDLPGFGEAERPPPDRFAYDLPAFAAALADAIEQLRVGPVALLGHSLGGGVALKVAAHRPELVERLVLVSTLYYPPPIPPAGRLLLLPGVGPLLWRHAVRRSEWARRQRADVKDPSVITDEYVDHYYGLFSRPGAREAAYATVQAIFRMPGAAADPGRVRAPTLLVWGDEDRVVPLSDGKRLSRSIPGARLRVVPACGHTPFVERPEEFLRQVEPFLSEAAEARSSLDVRRVQAGT